MRGLLLLSTVSAAGLAGATVSLAGGSNYGVASGTRARIEGRIIGASSGKIGVIE